ncbi:unnamed protein product (macronuclear) [Paramecium tetraurelia]|uniref:Uncharacterized protein n=1 Tax=Paramecium tetraurelia TaxID=5888 RepID=A0D9I9_PARTE|nr:uncharacterized protein GSPATT00014636001 [Paramecium tetraurelia]CAK79706.1 unnamed protein product [Paramecium tetraurelia]|eukprot:XP_001447103.1 hypothetical protein (macronuclear) [Paramecium tetraurelia strain d4-2]
MNQDQFDNEGDPQQQFLDAFKELLEVQNQRMYNGNDMLNQYCPQLQYPVILPTQIPNTFIINMGPYLPHIQQPQIHPQQTQQARMAPQIQQNQFLNHQSIKEEEHEEKKQPKNWLQQRK